MVGPGVSTVVTIGRRREESRGSSSPGARFFTECSRASARAGLGSCAIRLPHQAAERTERGRRARRGRSSHPPDLRASALQDQCPYPMCDEMAAPPVDRRQPLPGKGGPPARARVSRFLGRISAAPEPEKEPTLVGRRGGPGRVHPLGRVSACRSGIHLGSRTPSLPAGSCRRPSPPPACRTRSAS